MPKAKKSKENPLEDSIEDTDLQADNCVSQQTNNSNKQINEINSDVSHASLDTGRGEDIEMIETNESDSSETENDHRKFDGNLETMENDLSESSSVGLPNANLNSSNEIPNSCELLLHLHFGLLSNKITLLVHTPGLFFQMERWLSQM
jgi:hypothetical protein